jgi:hypothetical protein
MTTVPNQKTLIIHKSPIDKQKGFTSFDHYAQQTAMVTINKIGALKLWFYLMKNKNGITWALSPSDCEEWGIGIDAYRTGVKELIRLGYLRRKSGNEYDFFDLPQPAI